MATPSPLARAARCAPVLGAAALLVAGCSSGGTPAPRGTPAARASLPPPAHVSAAGTVLATGDDAAGQLGLATQPSGSSTVTLQPVRGVAGSGRLTGVRALAGGGRHSLAVRSDGTVVAWGANDAGQLGTGDRTPAAAPTPVRAPDGRPGLLTGAVDVSADSNLSMVLLRNGRVVTFGAGNYGQRGIGRRAAPLTPTTVVGVGGTGVLGDVTAISADGSTALALRRDGSVVAWGANEDGQLGDGTTATATVPQPVHGPGGRGLLRDVRAIALAGQSANAVTTDGSLLAWGGNDRGQLGDGTLTPHRFPAPVHGIDGAGRLGDVVEVSAAEKHVFARLAGGRIVGWGFGNAGQLGNGTAANSPVPTLVKDPTGQAPLTGVARVVAGEAYGVAVLDDGAVLTWGAGSAGQLGDGSRQARVLPGPVSYQGHPLANVRLVGAGVRHLLLSADP